MVWIGAGLTIAAWLIFGVWASIVSLIIGVVVLDFGIQSALISNQHIIYALDADARSRLNTVFMTGMFLGGAAGSAMATFAWGEGGWHLVSLLGAALGVAAFAVKLVHPRGHAATMVGK